MLGLFYSQVRAAHLSGELVPDFIATGKHPFFLADRLVEAAASFRARLNSQDYEELIRRARVRLLELQGSLRDMQSVEAVVANLPASKAEGGGEESCLALSRVFSRPR